MSKKFLNECIDCGYIGEEGLWKIEGYEGLCHVKEVFKVGPEIGPEPEHFDLDVIDSKMIMEKYKLTEEKVESLIMNGEPCCPKCQSLNFFEAI